MEVQKRLHYTDILNHLYCHIWSISQLKFSFFIEDFSPLCGIDRGQRVSQKWCLEGFKRSWWRNRKSAWKSIREIWFAKISFDEDCCFYQISGCQKSDSGCQFQHSLGSINVTYSLLIIRGKFCWCPQVAQGQLPSSDPCSASLAQGHVSPHGNTFTSKGTWTVVVQFIMPSCQVHSAGTKRFLKSLW